MTIKKVVLRSRELDSLKITQETVLRRITDGIEIVYGIEHEGNEIVFTSTSIARVGDTIVFNGDRWMLIPKDQFEQRFDDLPEELDIRTSSNNDRVTAYLTRKNEITGRMIFEIRKIDGSWIMSNSVCDVSGYDMVSAIVIVQVFDAAVRKVKEIDPTGWFNL